jgi:hypothetical protein
LPRPGHPLWAKLYYNILYPQTKGVFKQYKETLISYD